MEWVLLLFEGKRIHEATMGFGLGYGSWRSRTASGEPCKEPTCKERTNMELRRLGFEMSPGRKKKKRAAVSSLGKEKSSTLFLTPFKPIHSSLKQ